ncbi:hypothetical protein ES703_62971 [subsurface metagenome]
MVAGVARHLEPLCLASAGAYHSDATGGICLANLWILEGGNLRVKGICVIYKMKITHSLGIELPVGNLFAVGTPAESIPQSEFFLVDPVRGAIDNGVRAIHRQLCDAIVLKILYEEVVFANVPNAVSTRRKLRKHQR